MRNRGIESAAVRVTAMFLAAAAVAAVPAQAQFMDQQAVDLLRRSTDYLSSLQQFRVTTQIFREDVLEAGHRVDFQMTGSVVARRPNKLHGERTDAQDHQVLYYDGTTVTLSHPRSNVYAREAAPPTIEEFFAFAQDSLGLWIPLSDLIWRDVFPLMMQDVTVAVVIGREEIDGVMADHLLFSRPGVDFQIWIPAAGPPLPIKYIVTDTGTPELLSISALMSEWDVEYSAPDEYFSFVPPQGAQEIPFLKVDGQR